MWTLLFFVCINCTGGPAETISIYPFTNEEACNLAALKMDAEYKILRPTDTNHHTCILNN